MINRGNAYIADRLFAQFAGRRDFHLDFLEAGSNIVEEPPASVGATLRVVRL